MRMLMNVVFPLEPCPTTAMRCGGRAVVLHQVAAAARTGDGEHGGGADDDERCQQPAAAADRSRAIDPAAARLTPHGA